MNMNKLKLDTDINKTNHKANLHKSSFEFCSIIGKGGFGKVWRVKSNKTKESFALKEMPKLKIIDKKSEKAINSERELLSMLNHSFIVNMHYAFQDNDNLYLVMDLLTGGDLRYHIARYRKFSEEQTRFFIACIMVGLDYIHKNKVIHRDIKPENLVLDDKGYLRITDFGIAKENMEDNSSETSGTPGYMSPEVMRKKHHSFPVDFFALGVIGFEFMTGKRPYYGNNRKEIKEKMLSVQAMIKESEAPDCWSPESVDFINNLLLRKPEMRLGSNKGVKELMNHPWLKYYPWKELEGKSLLAPFIPENQDNYDKRYCEKIDKITDETKERYEEIAQREEYKNVFNAFYYNKDELMEKKKILESIKVQHLPLPTSNRSTLNFTNIPNIISTNNKNTNSLNNSIVQKSNMNMNSNANIIYITPFYNCKLSKDSLKPQTNTQKRQHLKQQQQLGNSCKSTRDMMSNSSSNKNSNGNNNEMNLFLKKHFASKEINSINNHSKINNSIIPHNSNNDSFRQKLSNEGFAHLGKKPFLAQHLQQSNSKLYLLKSHIRSMSVLNNKSASKTSIPPIIPLHSNKSNERTIKHSNHSRENFNAKNGAKSLQTGKIIGNKNYNSNSIFNSSKSISRSSSEYLRLHSKFINAISPIVKLHKFNG